MWACLIYLVLFLGGFMVTSAGASMGVVDTLANKDMIFVSVIEQYLPSILGGIMLAGLMAAIMSSADAMLLAISAGIAHDIYKEHINPKATERFVTGLGLAVMIIASIVGILIAIDPPGLIAIMVGWVGGFLLSGFGFPIVLGLWWNVRTRQVHWLGCWGVSSCFDTCCRAMASDKR